MRHIFMRLRIPYYNRNTRERQGEDFVKVWLLRRGWISFLAVQMGVWMMEIISSLADFVWGPGLLVLLLGTGFYLSVKHRFFQCYGWRKILTDTFGSLFRNGMSRGTKGKLTQLQTFSTALAAAMGTGNLIGVAGALLLGGAGAIFWMWLSALLGMMLTYTENRLAMRFAKGALQGPMAYLHEGLHCPWLAVIYAVLCIGASFGMGNLTQSSAIASLMEEAFAVPNWATGLGIMVLLLCILLRGAKGVGGVLQWLMPLLSVGYMLAAICVIVRHAAVIPAAFRQIIMGAFGIDAITGGVSGAALRHAVETGLRHGVFSNEAGLGSSALVHAGGDSMDGELQGEWSMVEVALDTLVCCTLTALAILTSGVLDRGEADTAGTLLAAAFATLFGASAVQFLAVITALFAFATLIGWCCCGEKAVMYLWGRRFGERALTGYRVVFCVLAGIGAVASLETVWALSDIANGLMAIPNLVACWLLDGTTKKPSLP